MYSHIESNLSEQNIYAHMNVCINGPNQSHTFSVRVQVNSKPMLKLLYLSNFFPVLFTILFSSEISWNWENKQQFPRFSILFYFIHYVGESHWRNVHNPISKPLTIVHRQDSFPIKQYSGNRKISIKKSSQREEKRSETSGNSWGCKNITCMNFSTD